MGSSCHGYPLFGVRGWLGKSWNVNITKHAHPCTSSFIRNCKAHSISHLLTLTNLTNRLTLTLNSKLTSTLKSCLDPQTVLPKNVFTLLVEYGFWYLVCSKWQEHTQRKRKREHTILNSDFFIEIFYSEVYIIGRVWACEQEPERCWQTCSLVSQTCFTAATIWLADWSLRRDRGHCETIG